MDLFDPTLFKLIALCGVALIAKLWFDYDSGRSLPDRPHDDRSADCDESQCLLQDPAPSA